MKSGGLEPDARTVVAMEVRARSLLAVARELLDNSHFDDAVSRAVRDETICGLRRCELDRKGGSDKGARPSRGFR